MTENAWIIGVRTYTLGQEGMTWITMGQGKEVTNNKEPGMSVWQHIGIRFLGLLPLEDEL